MTGVTYAQDLDLHSVLAAHLFVQMILGKVVTLDMTIVYTIYKHNI